jgi:hypothetical protein
MSPPNLLPFGFKSQKIIKTVGPAGLGRKHRRRKAHHTKAEGEEARSLLGSAIDKAQATLFLVEHLEGSQHMQAQYAESLTNIKRHAIANAELVGKVLELFYPISRADASSHPERTDHGPRYHIGSGTNEKNPRDTSGRRRRSDSRQMDTRRGRGSHRKSQSIVSGHLRGTYIETRA